MKKVGFCLSWGKNCEDRLVSEDRVLCRIAKSLEKYAEIQMFDTSYTSDEVSQLRLDKCLYSSSSCYNKYCELDLEHFYLTFVGVPANVLDKPPTGVLCVSIFVMEGVYPEFLINLPFEKTFSRMNKGYALATGNPRPNKCLDLIVWALSLMDNPIPLKLILPDRNLYETYKEGKLSKYYSYLMQTIEMNDIDCEVMGGVSPITFEKYLSQASIYINAQRCEANPLSGLEALCYGIPIVMRREMINFYSSYGPPSSFLPPTIFQSNTEDNFSTIWSLKEAIEKAQSYQSIFDEISNSFSNRVQYDKVGQEIWTVLDSKQQPSLGITQTESLERILIGRPHSQGAELGVFEGSNLFDLLERFLNLQMIGVDSWLGEGPYMDSSLDWDEIQRNIELKAEEYEGRVKLMNMTTVQASKMVEDESLDFIFIDAGHSYSAMTGDLLNWVPKVRQSGVITGHDLFLEGVEQAVEEIIGLQKISIDGDVWYINRDEVVL